MRNIIFIALAGILTALYTETNAQYIVGPSSVTVNTTHTYSYNTGVIVFSPQWRLSNGYGSIISQSQNGANYTVTITWNTIGSETLALLDGFQALSELNVSITAPPPSAPTANGPGSISNASFTANWTTVSTATNYRLDVSTASNFSSYVSGFSNLYVSTNSQNVTGLSANTTYYYRVRAQNSGGTSVNSDTISVLTAPPIPTATDATNITHQSFSANWINVTGANMYAADISTTDNFAPANTITLTSAGPTISVTGLNGNTTYHYRVRARNTAGSWSQNSYHISTATLPTPPNVTTATNVTASSFTANWGSVDGATQYLLDVATDIGFSNVNTTVLGVTTANISNLTGGTTYYYRVRAENSGWTTGYSDIITVTLIPAVPSIGPASDITVSSFRANWGTTPGATSYLLYVSTDPGFSNPVGVYNGFPVSANYHTIDGLSEGTQYYYRVKAWNTSGPSELTEPIAVATLPAAPVAAEASDIGQDSFTASWSSVASATGYLLDVSAVSNFATFVSVYRSYPVSGTSLTVGGLNPNTSYSYRVRAVKGTGYSTVSNTATLLTLPKAPIALNASNIGSNSFTVNWEPMAGITNFTLDVSTSADFTSPVSPYNGLQVTGTSFQVTGLSELKTYYYRLKALNSTGESQASNVVIGISMDQNYIKTITVLKEDISGQGELNNAMPGERAIAFEYFDGLGRPMQSVAMQASPGQKDIVQPTIYDDLGREKNRYLPYVPDESNGFYKPKPVGESYAGSPHNLFYSNGTTDKVQDDPSPFSTTVFEPSPAGRVIEQSAPGAAWQPDGNDGYDSPLDRTVKFAYETNTSGEVLLWTVSYPSGYSLNIVGAGTASSPVYYAANRLYRNKTKDEEHHEVIEYKDRQGKVILKKVQAPGGQWAQTYYIYDAFGQLVCVLPPEAVARLNTEYHQSGSDDSSKDNFLKRLAFRYSYDARKRMIIKQVPGAEPVFMVYDKRDRLVLTQDGNQRTSEGWTFTKYDAFNRPVITGKYVSAGTRDDMAGNVDAYYASPLATGRAWFETYAGGEGTRFGYDNKSFPNTPVESDYLTVTYYDKHDGYNTPAGYTYVNESSGQPMTDPETSLEQRSSSSIASVNLKGQVTATLVRNLFDGVMLRTVNYYDEKYRLIQSIGDHQKGKTRATSIVDFSGKVVYSKRTYDVNGEQTTILENPHYDAAGRLLWIKHSVNGGADVIVAKNDYNELGQLIDKKLHSANVDGTGARQSVDYRYNVRGWLTRMNDSDLSEEEGDPKDYFGMNLAYETDFGPGLTVANRNYNGNISAIKWSANLGLSSVKEMAYDFTYDQLNRLKHADHFQSSAPGNWAAGEYHEKNLTYDLNGNILNLHRTGTGGGDIDKLVYNYGSGTSYGNRLLYVKDITTDADDKVKGFADNNAGDVQDYTYDANGNMTRDLNKGIGTTLSDANSRITYNFLNLPETVSKGGNTIQYVYDATGRKLAQRTTFGDATKEVDYIGELQFENNRLQFITHPEGRVVMAETELVYFHSADTDEGITASNTTLSTVTLNGGEKYVKAVVNGTGARIGIFPIGGTIGVDEETKYLIRVKGYTTNGNPVRLLVETNGSELSPGAKLPSNTVSESWVEQVITIPQGHTALRIGLVWDSSSTNEELYFNELEVTKLSAAANPEYQYHLKDHLGNVRMTFTTKEETDSSLATLEVDNVDEERSQFIYYDEAVRVNSRLFDHTHDAQSVPAIQVTGVSVSPSVTTIATGQTIQLIRTIVPLEADNLNTTWVTSNSSVATVSGTGLVTAVAPGSATISAITVDGGFTASSAITITDSGGVSLLNPEFDSGTSNWVLEDFTGPDYSHGGNSYSVVTGAGLSGTNALFVDVVNANNGGWTLQVRQDLNFRLEVGKTYSISVMAKAQSAREINISFSAIGTNVEYWNQLLNLTTTAQTFSYEFTCTNTGVNSESGFRFNFLLAKGVISDVWIDNVIVQDITNGPGVTTVPVTGVSLSPASQSLTVGQAAQLTATITPSDASNQSVSWSSSNAGVATVSSSGLVTAVGAGTATITATSVSDPTVSGTSAVTVNSTGNLVLNPQFDQGTTNWTMEDFTGPDYSNGGNSYSVVTGAGLSGTNALFVDVVNANNGGWTLQVRQDLNFRLEVGKTYSISVMAKAQSAREVNISFSSIGTNVEYWNQLLNVTTNVQTFSYEFTCTNAGVNGESGFRFNFLLAKGVISDVWIDNVIVQDITNVPVAGISVSPSPLNISVGQKSQLTKTITPSDATNQSVTWTSANTAIALVSNSGLVTGVAEGTTTITATTIDGNKTSQVTVNVTPPLSSYSTRLTGTEHERYGLAKSLSVMPGDIIRAEVYAKYLDPEQNNWNAALTNLMMAIAQGSAPTGTFIDGGATGSIDGTTFPYPDVLERTNDEGNGPKAYLNYIVFDRDVNFVTGGFKRITTAAKEDGSDVDHERLAFDGANEIVITEPGYVYIYLSNENETPVEVFFDDFKVEHLKGPVVSSQDYYAFGLTFNSYQRENSVQQPYLFNGKEIQDELNLSLVDYGFRMYDPTLGRWHVLDPLQEDEYDRAFEEAFGEELGDEFNEDALYDGRRFSRGIRRMVGPMRITPENSAIHYNISPYAYVLNNPINFTDWMGLDTLKEVTVTATRLPSIPYEIGVDLTLIQLGQPLYSLKPVGVFGSKPGSSLASAGLSKVFPQRIPALKKAERKVISVVSKKAAKKAGTAVLGRFLGRLVPGLGYLFLAKDIYDYKDEIQEIGDGAREINEKYRTNPDGSWNAGWIK